MRPKLTAILTGFLILGLTDGLFAYACPIDYSLESFSLVPHFFFIGMLVYLYNKDIPQRIGLGFALGVMYDVLFSGVFPFSSIAFPLCAYVAGFFPRWSNSPRLSPGFFVLFAFLIDFVPWFAIGIFAGHGSIISWLVHMELFTVLADFAVLYAIRYFADVMDRYFKILRIRQRQEDKRRMSAMHRQ